MKLNNIFKRIVTKFSIRQFFREMGFLVFTVQISIIKLVHSRKNLEHKFPCKKN